MHEASIAAGILRIVQEEAQRHNAARVSCIRLQVGLLAGIEAKTLTSCFELYAEGTPAEGAVLAIETMPMRGICRVCGHRHEIHRRVFACPACQSAEVDYTGGREMTIAALEVQPHEGAHP